VSQGQGDGGAALAPTSEAARKRAAVETYSRHEAALRRTARRYSLCADDADDALQRGLEILLRKAPSTDPRELIRWTQTVVKHEALAVRRERERILSGPAAASAQDAVDWVALIPAEGAGPAERAERREVVARTREALQALKPQELRALTLLAEGYSYREIGEITGFSNTKINRCLAEGRERFRKLLARNADGRRCAEMGPRLSAFCDGEAGAEEQAQIREHLRACAHCRATLRAYRAAPAAAAALAPALPLDRSLFDRAHDAAAALASRFGGGGTTDSALSQVAASGGTRGVGMAALAKVLAVCAGTVGGAAACAATGVVPTPLAFDSGREEPRIERQVEESARSDSGAGVEYETEAPVAEAPTATEQTPEKEADPEPEPQAVTPETSSGAVEYASPPAPAAPPPSATTSSSAGSASGEFGP